MPSQQVEIAEAITGIKRALKREREAPSDQPAVAGTNRGNKLKQGARYVHEGSLTYASGPEAYKQRIEHAGYTRYILERNPRRYNEYGEELEDSETDEEADADAADQNAYSGIRLEELLCPLKHPSELPNHPTLSHAYLSNALPDMVLSTHEKLRQERANLWRAKYLNRQLIGDASWIPAGHVESPEDWELFEPRNNNTQKQPSRVRKRRVDGSRAQNGISGPFSMQSEGVGVSKEKKQDGLATQPKDVDMDAPETIETFRNDEGADDDATNSKEAADAIGREAPEPKSAGLSDTAMEDNMDVPKEPQPNGVDPNTTDQKDANNDTQGGARNQENNIGTNHDPMVGLDDQIADEPIPAAVNEVDPSPAAPPPPPLPRRITRALAATNNHSSNHSNAPTPALSPASSSTTTSSSFQLQIDPLYLVPQSANPSNSATAFHGLLPEEALETRRILTLYVQKQEESVRGYEAILGKLLTAQRLRNEVLQMCKTEEHVGDLSDGEDWIDTERWGLQSGELKKGKDEDDDVMEENTISGRKGKRRARN